MTAEQQERAVVALEDIAKRLHKIATVLSGVVIKDEKTNEIEGLRCVVEGAVEVYSEKGDWNDE